MPQVSRGAPPIQPCRTVVARQKCAEQNCAAELRAAELRACLHPFEPLGVEAERHRRVRRRPGRPELVRMALPVGFPELPAPFTLAPLRMIHSCCGPGRAAAGCLCYVAVVLGCLLSLAAAARVVARVWGCPAVAPSSPRGLPLVSACCCWLLLVCARCLSHTDAARSDGSRASRRWRCGASR